MLLVTQHILFTSDSHRLYITLNTHWIKLKIVYKPLMWYLDIYVYSLIRKNVYFTGQIFAFQYNLLRFPCT